MRISDWSSDLWSSDLKSWGGSNRCVSRNGSYRPTIKSTPSSVLAVTISPPSHTDMHALTHVHYGVTTLLKRTHSLQIAIILRPASNNLEIPLQIGSGPCAEILCQYLSISNVAK